MPLAKPEYPKVLTADNWNKKKGLIAKAAGKTGIGEALTALEKLFGEVEWQKFEFLEYVTRAPSAERLERCKTDAEAAYHNVKKVIDQALFCERQAEQVERKFSTNKLIPKDTIVLLEHIADLAKKFQKRLADIKGHVDQQCHTAAAAMGQQRKGFFEEIRRKLDRYKADLDECRTQHECGEVLGIAHHACLDDLNKARYMVTTLGPIVERWIHATYKSQTTINLADPKNLKKEYHDVTAALELELHKAMG
jgi:hypothetical protein